jgi:hypothetical protein
MNTRSTEKEKRISAEAFAFHPHPRRAGVRKQPRVRSTPKSAPLQHPCKAQVSTLVRYGVSDGHHVNTFMLPSQMAQESAGHATNATKPRLILRHKISDSFNPASTGHVNSNRKDGSVTDTQQPKITPEDVYYHIGWITNSDPPIPVKASKHGGYLIMRVYSPSGAPGTADRNSPGLKRRLQIKEVTLDPQLFSASSDNINTTNMVKKEMIVEQFLTIMSNIQSPSTSKSQPHLAKKRTELTDGVTNEESLQPPRKKQVHQASQPEGLAVDASYEHTVLAAHGHLAVGKDKRNTGRTVWVCVQPSNLPNSPLRMTVDRHCEEEISNKEILFYPKYPKYSLKAIPLIRFEISTLLNKSKFLTVESIRRMLLRISC